MSIRVGVDESPSSAQPVAAGSKQSSVPSLQVTLHSGPPAQGSPGETQTPLEQVSAPLQKVPSPQARPLELFSQVDDNDDLITVPVATDAK